METYDVQYCTSLDEEEPPEGAEQESPYCGLHPWTIHEPCEEFVQVVCIFVQVDIVFVTNVLIILLFKAT